MLAIKRRRRREEKEKSKCAHIHTIQDASITEEDSGSSFEDAARAQTFAWISSNTTD